MVKFSIYLNRRVFVIDTPLLENRPVQRVVVEGDTRRKGVNFYYFSFSFSSAYWKKKKKQQKTKNKLESVMAIGVQKICSLHNWKRVLLTTVLMVILLIGLFCLLDFSSENTVLVGNTGKCTYIYLLYLLYITKTLLYNFDLLKPHFYIVKLGFTGVYIIFLISAQKHRVWVLVRTALQRRF